MKVRRESDGKPLAALTLVEVLVLIGVVVTLFAVFMPALFDRPVKAPRIKCAYHLKQIGLAFRIFANDHHETFPMEIPVRDGGTKELVEFGLVLPHLLVISNELTVPTLLICPSDTRTAASNFGELRDRHISYFVGLDARQSNSQSLLAGDRNITDGSPGTNRMLSLATARPVGWTGEIHKHAGNLLLGDGSVQQVDSAGLQQTLRDSGVATNRLAIP
jgi:hypothetical protein